MKTYEKLLLDSARLLAQAKTVTDEQNKAAVACMQQELRIGGLELLWLRSWIDGTTQTVCYLKSGQVDLAASKRYIYEESHGVSAEYAVYPIEGAKEWTEQELDRIECFMLMLYQANERQRLAADVDYYRYHDPQTRHTNMVYFSNCCERYIKNNTIQNYTAMAVNMIGFTKLNLELGSTKCDTILVRYMDWLKDGLDADEVVSRISGDQFALLIHKDHEDLLLSKLRSSDISYGMTLFEHVKISSEAGIYRLTAEAGSCHHIIQALSSVLNQVKSSMKNQFDYYDPMTADMNERRRYYETEFEKALLHEDIHVYFQPKVSLKNYDLIGAEALSRWIVNGEVVPPDSFIPILEETTRICSLDFYVLEHVCKSIRDWIRHGVKPVKVSVNFSRRHLANENLVHDIVQMIDRYDVPYRYIEVELTETTVDADYEALKKIVQGLRGYGIESSVDDFGMGYSSLSLIRDVPFKVLKIDKSFLGDKNMETDERQRSMMKHVISMANDLGMECIAEGVESMEHVQLLKESKCYMAQGFLFNRPIPQEQFEEILLKAQKEPRTLESNGK